MSTQLKVIPNPYSELFSINNWHLNDNDPRLDLIPEDARTWLRDRGRWALNAGCCWHAPELDEPIVSAG